MILTLSFARELYILTYLSCRHIVNFMLIVILFNVRESIYYISSTL